MKLNGKLLERIKYQLICAQYPDRFQLVAAENELSMAVDDFWIDSIWCRNFIPGMALVFSSGDGSEE